MRREKMSDEERKEKWKAYHQQYRERNPEKIREYNNKWIIKRAAKLIAQQTKEKEEKISSNLLFDSHPIIVIPELAVKIGLNESIIYCELISKYLYFKEQGKTTTIDNCDYFYCTVEDLEKSTTLSRYKQEPTIKRLCKLDLIRMKTKGVPPKRYFYINPNVGIYGGIDVKTILTAQGNGEYKREVIDEAPIPNELLKETVNIFKALEENKSNNKPYEKIRKVEEKI